VRPHLGAFLCAAALLAGIVYFGKHLHAHYPIHRWLFWRYAGYWLGTLTLGLGMYGLGHVVLKRIGPKLPLHEHAMVAFGLGTFGFELLMFGLGLAKGYKTAAFFAIPLALLGAVALPLYEHAKHVKKVLVRSHRRSERLGAKAFLLAFGLLGLGMVYFYVLTPHNI